MGFQSRLTPQDHTLIKEMALRGEKLETIGKAVSTPVTKQRIKQILKIMNINSFDIRRTQNEKEHTDKMFKKWGPEWANKEHRRSFIYQTMREKFRRKKANAPKNGYEFTIDFGELTFPTHCPILGIELDYFTEQMEDASVSFDRMDSDKGYISGNVAIISWKANRIKNNGTADEHQKIADFLRQF